MAIAAAQLASQLRQGLRTLYTVFGDEALLVQEACDAIRSAARAHGHSERTVFTVQGANFDWSAVVASGASISLFAERQIIELRIPSGKPGKDGAAALQTLAERSARDDTTLTLVVLPRLDSSTSKSAWFESLQQHGVCVRVDNVPRAALPQWIAQRLAAQGQHVVDGDEGQHSLQFFADHVEGNLLAAHQEVAKLALLYPSGELRLRDIEAAVAKVARYDPFDLAQTVLAGRIDRVARMIDGLQAEGVSPVLVHFALCEDIRALAQLRDALDAGQPWPVALRQQRVWGAREALMQNALQGLHAAQLAQWLRHAHTVDGIVKGLKPPGWPHDPWAALLRLAVMVARVCAKTSGQIKPGN